MNIEGASKAEQAKKLPFIVYRDVQVFVGSSAPIV